MQRTASQFRGWSDFAQMKLIHKIPHPQFSCGLNSANLPASKIAVSSATTIATKKKGSDHKPAHTH